MYNGEHATAIRHATMALSLSPRDPHVFFVEHVLMVAHFFSRHLAEADMLAESVFERNPGHASALNFRLAILGHLGRKTEAAECLALLQSIDPSVTIDRLISRIPLRAEDRAYYIDGLERAAVPR